MARRTPPLLRKKFVMAKTEGASVFADGGAAYLFSAKDRKTLYDYSVAAASLHFVAKFLPLRFTNYIKRSPFNYYKGSKGKNPLPLIDSGILKATVLSGAGIKTTATGNGARAKIGFPMSADTSRNKDIRRVLETVTEKEAEKMAKVFAAEAAGMVAGAQKKGRGNKLTLAGG